MNNIKVIKFLPYFPPHKWGLESHVQERSKRRVKKWYGEVMNVVPSMGQETIMDHWAEYIYYKHKKIWYIQYGYSVLVYPAFDLIPTFPFPKFWKKDFWIIMRLAKRFHANIINTHTRFFLTSLLGGIFAKCTRTKRIHIEHWVDFVKLASKRKSALALLFDQIIGRWIFRYSSWLIGISYGCKKFMQRFTKRHIDVVYRGMDLPLIENQKLDMKDWTLTRIAFVGRLVKLKGVDLLLNVVKKILDIWDKHIHLDIVGDGDEMSHLKQQVHDLSLSHHVFFLGFKEKNQVITDILPHTHIVVNPSYQEWLPTSVLEWLLSGCVVVATDVWWTPEISNKEDLILVKPGDEWSLYLWLKKAIENYIRIAGLSEEYVKTEFDRNKNIEKYRKIYLWMIWHEK